MNLSNELSIVMKQAGLPLTLDGVIKAKAALSAMPQTDLIRKLKNEAGDIISRTLDNALSENKRHLDSELERKKEYYQNSQNERNIDAYKTALKRATEKIESYKSSDDSFMADFNLRSLKSSLETYSATLFLDKNLENQYKQSVNELLRTKKIQITL